MKDLQSVDPGCMDGRPVDHDKERKPPRTDEVLRFFVDRFSGEIGCVVLVKLAYMADLEAWRHLGRPITNLRYRVDNHGPFDRSFYDSIERLKAQDLIAEAEIPFPTGTGFRYSSRRAEPYSFTEAEMAVLQFIATTFEGKSMSDILDVAYSTEPFAAVKGRGKGAEIKLKEAKFKGAREIGNIKLEHVIEGFAAIRDGRSTDVGEWVGG